jgi:cathepsin L
MSQINNSPIAVTVDATRWSSYRSGIFNNCPLSSSSTNLSALLVGFVGGAWKIKNSWGIGWAKQAIFNLLVVILVGSATRLV